MKLEDDKRAITSTCKMVSKLSSVIYNGSLQKRLDSRMTRLGELTVNQNVQKCQ